MLGVGKEGFTNKATLPSWSNLHIYDCTVLLVEFYVTFPLDSSFLSRQIELSVFIHLKTFTSNTPLHHITPQTPEAPHKFTVIISLVTLDEVGPWQADLLSPHPPLLLSHCINKQINKKKHKIYLNKYLKILMR